MNKIQQNESLQNKSNNIHPTNSIDLLNNSESKMQLPIQITLKNQQKDDLF